MDLELAIADLLVDAYLDTAPEHTLGPLRFRLPTGADLEAAAEAADVDAGAALLLERCVLDGALTDPEREALEDELERLDPQAELRIAVACPSCDQRVDATVDPGALLLDELADGADALFREVHALARHYHWSEREILGLELRRRRRYLDLLVADEGVEETSL